MFFVNFTFLRCGGGTLGNVSFACLLVGLEAPEGFDWSSVNESSVSYSSKLESSESSSLSSPSERRQKWSIFLEYGGTKVDFWTRV